MKKNVMLITPPYHCGVVESAGRWPNLGFLYIGGELEKHGYEIDFYDAMSKFHDYDQIRERIRKSKPDFIGVTAITATIVDAVKVLEVAKEEIPGIVTIIGGVHPTFMYAEILEKSSGIVDYCVIGEGEHTMPELLNMINSGGEEKIVNGIAYIEDGNVVKTAVRPFVSDLDSLSPAWHLADWNDYPLYFIDNSKVAILSSSRGCIHKCSFCSQHKFWQGSYRDRAPEKFVAEIEHLFDKYGINVFFIADEYPTNDRERWVQILDLLIEKDLGIHILLETCVGDIIRDEDIIGRYREAGVLFIYLGVESTDNQKLIEFKKETRFEDSKKALQIVRDAGMIVESSLILGAPDETPESIKETLKLAKEYNADFMHFLLIAPWPYADLYDKLEPYIEVWDYSKYNLVEPIIKPLSMTRDQLMKEVLNCYKKYYMNKMPEWASMKGNDLKRSCLIRGMKAIMENSFLKDHMKGLGGMPKGVMKMMEKMTDNPGN
ncbi:MAG: cobalamin-dependent protein [Candidatus Aminicenantes bacterium]|nr:cobalamin-dependent protein [Candidatus Aminicenantes bacterium]